MAAVTSPQIVRRGTYRLKVAGVRAVALAVLIGVWLYARRPGGVSPLILPRIRDVAREFVTFLHTRELYKALGVTLVEIVIAFVIAAVLGVAVAFWAARTDVRARVVEPLLVWGYLVPHILFYPIIILFFGVGMPSKVAYAASSAIFPIGFNCLRAFRGVDPKLIGVGRAYGASPRQLDRQIKLPAAVPLASAGLRIGAALAMVTVVTAEMISSTKGLGYLLKFYSQSFNPAKSYAIILVILVVVGVLQVGISRLFRQRDHSGR